MFGYNKYVVYGVLAAIAAAVIGTYIYMWRANIRHEALLEFNTKQMERVLKDQEAFLKTMKDVAELQKKAVDDLNSKNDELQTRLTKLDAYLNSTEAQKGDREASEILKRTIEELSGGIKK